jgi:hypothetical protein
MEKTLEQLNQEMRELCDGQVRRMQAEHREFMRYMRWRLAFAGLLVLGVVAAEIYWRSVT